MSEDRTEQADKVALREKRREELEQTSFSANQQGGALMQPTNGKELMDMANLMSGSGQMVRDFYRGNPGDCAALIMICQPYGFNPFMVSWKTYKASKNADAPIAYEGQLVNAMVNQSAPVRGRLRYHYEGDGDDMTCTVTGIDRETGEEIVYTSPPVKSIPVKNSPLWKGDPKQQLGYYSARSWARRHFPELLLGIYTREEIETAPPRDITPKAKEGGFADMAKSARTDTQEPPKNAENLGAPSDGEEQGKHPSDGVEDAEIIPDEDQDTAPPEIDRYAPEYEEGAIARQEGKPIASNPHMDDPEKMGNWIAGWKGGEE